LTSNSRKRGKDPTKVETRTIHNAHSPSISKAKENDDISKKVAELLESFSGKSSKDSGNMFGSKPISKMTFEEGIQKMREVNK